jgi:hypothetical protein
MHTSSTVLVSADVQSFMRVDRTLVCDHCESAGREYVTQWHQTMLGSTFCTRCQADRVMCNVCGQA